MNKKELINAVAEKTGLNKKQALSPVDVVFEVIIEGVVANYNVWLVSFGTFSKVKRNVWGGQNPRIGAPLKIPAPQAPRFKAAKGLKAALSRI